MTRQDFLVQLSQSIEAEPPLTGEEILAETAGWDSVAVMTLLAMADAQCGVVLAPKDIGNCTTVNDLLALVFERHNP